MKTSKFLIATVLAVAALSASMAALAKYNGEDLSRKGLKQSFGLMVNYLYEVAELEARHEQFAEKKVSHSSTVKRLLKPAA